MSATTLFITGTDTGVGKTTVACALIRLARQQGIRVCGWKPVATGCERTPDGLRHADALALQRAAGTNEPYERINPYAFEPAVAPHLAAQVDRCNIRLIELNRIHAGLAHDYGLVIVEGAGGWMVPLGRHETVAGWVAQQGWPVLVVVGMRLGCLNHALLSTESVTRRARLAGWMANALSPEMPLLAENLAVLRQRIPAPCWGVVPSGAETVSEPTAVWDALRKLMHRVTVRP
ncbi:MAG: dethiobiotin synthase [Nevskiales bacterium]|nr:dethiobiotin synthase [Nevskiales bacterium]